MPNEGASASIIEKSKEWRATVRVFSGAGRSTAGKDSDLCTMYLVGINVCNFIYHALKKKKKT